MLGIPRWWPTGLARERRDRARERWRLRGRSGITEVLHRELTERRYLCLRFNFPFAEAGKKRPDSIAVFRRTLRAAVSTLARDPTAAPAHLFLGGRGLGVQVACELAAARLRVDGLFLLGYPLHPQEEAREAPAGAAVPDRLAMLFLAQGTRDRQLPISTCCVTPSRASAPPPALLVSEEADHNFKVLKKSRRTQEEVYDEELSGRRHLDPEGAGSMRPATVPRSRERR